MGPARDGMLGSSAAQADPEISDSFTKREKANEDYYVKQQEKAKSVVPRPVPKATREHNIPITNVRRKQTLTLDVVVFRLLALKEKISQQRKQLEELDKNM